MNVQMTVGAVLVFTVIHVLDQFIDEALVVGVDSIFSHRQEGFQRLQKMTAHQLQAPEQGAAEFGQHLYVQFVVFYRRQLLGRVGFQDPVKLIFLVVCQAAGAGTVNFLDPRHNIPPVGSQYTWRIPFT